MMKYCIGVVVYNPTETEMRNIDIYADSGVFGLVMVYDNSPKRCNYKFKNNICKYIFQNENSGLAKPYNAMIHEAENSGFDYLCIMDQDSSFKISEIKRLIEAIEIYENPENVAAFCPIILKKEPKEFRGNAIWNKVKWSINSGTILNIQCLKTHSIRYDENIFLDGLDYDFGLLVGRTNCSIMQYKNSFLVQSFGYKIKENQSYTYHNAYRYYLIAHNRKYIFKKHFGFFRGLINAQLKNVLLSFRILLNEENKMRKILACYKGILR